MASKIFHNHAFVFVNIFFAVAFSIVNQSQHYDVSPTSLPGTLSVLSLWGIGITLPFTAVACWRNRLWSMLTFFEVVLAKRIWIHHRGADVLVDFAKDSFSLILLPSQSSRLPSPFQTNSPPKSLPMPLRWALLSPRSDEETL